MAFNHDLLVSASSTVQVRASESGIAVTPVSFRMLRQVGELQRSAFRPPLAYGFSTLLVLWALPNVRFIVARSGERMVGCAIGDVQNGQSRVINICVDPTVRRNGVATRLLRELERALPTGDVVLMVEHDNHAAKELYLREGYLPISVSRDYYGRGLNGVWMQKSRTPNPPQKIRI